MSAPGRRQEDDTNLVVTALTTRAGATYDDQQVGQLVVGVLGEHSHALTAEGADASEDGTGRGTPVIAVPSIAYVADEVSSLMAGGGDRGYRIGADEAAGGQLVAYPLAVRGREGGAELEVGAPGDPMFALRAGNGGSSRSQLIATESGAVIVRRLTPLECERLQGCPDRWTDVDGASDSQRYKEMGNSVAVPVFAWVFGRLVTVDARMRERAA